MDQIGSLTSKKIKKYIELNKMKKQHKDFNKTEVLREKITSLNTRKSQKNHLTLASRI